MFKLVIFVLCLGCSNPSLIRVEYPQRFYTKEECQKIGLFQVMGTEDVFICMKEPDAASNDVQMGQQAKGRISN